MEISQHTVTGRQETRENALQLMQPRATRVTLQKPRNKHATGINAAQCLSGPQLADYFSAEVSLEIVSDVRALSP